MILSDISITRPVFASVISFLLVIFGLVAFDRLTVREYPDVDPPVVAIQTTYVGAPAAVLETTVTQIIENSVAGIEGIKFIQSRSRDGRSDVTIEFDINRDIEAAANDVRDKVATVLKELPETVDPPVIQKVDSDDDAIIWFNLVSDEMNLMELTDYARRYLEDRFSALEGVARVYVGGRLDYSMRIWLDRVALAARNLTANDVENILRAENIELPAGFIESTDRQFNVRVQRSYHTPNDFANLVLGEGSDGYLVRLSDVARVEIGPEQPRTTFRRNGISMIGLGIVKQSAANTLDVARAAKTEVTKINHSLPAGTELVSSYDSSIFIERAIEEVYGTLAIAIGLVILIIYLFLGNWRAVLIPAVTIPISLIATFIVLYALGFSVNLLTLLALILAIGLVVDDAIVVLENVTRRRELGETAMVAAFKGTRQVAFAVISTTLVLIAVFLPIAFLPGEIGRLFTEFAVTLSAAVAFSSLIALTLSPMMASKLLAKEQVSTRFNLWINHNMTQLGMLYKNSLAYSLRKPWIAVLLFALIFAACISLFKQLPREYVPPEDRGMFMLIADAPEGASFSYTTAQMELVEDALFPLIDSGDIERFLMRVPRAFDTQAYHQGFMNISLNDWDTGRRPADEIITTVNTLVGEIPGISAYPINWQPLVGRVGKPVQFVIGGGSREELVQWRDLMLEKMWENPRLMAIDHDYKETTPQLRIIIDRQRAGDLGVSIGNVNRTLETMLGSRKVTTYFDRDEEYNVILEGEGALQRHISDLANIYVRSERTHKLIPISSLVQIEEFADVGELQRYNRTRAITLNANLEPGYTLGEALDFMEKTARNTLPPLTVIDYKGASLKYKESSNTLIWIYVLSLLIVFLVMAGQFESYIHPLIIMFTVPLAIIGALFGLLIAHQSLNIYSQISLVMLIGLATKNGILIVEFINQLRDQGKDFVEAILTGSQIRLRPIIMTGLTTAIGAIPLIISSGAGAETRLVIGVVILSGSLVSTFFTLYIIPTAYALLARRTGSPGRAKQQLECELAQEASRI